MTRAILNGRKGLHDASPCGRRWPEEPDEGRSLALTRRFAAPSPRRRGTWRKLLRCHFQYRLLRNFRVNLDELFDKLRTPRACHSTFGCNSEISDVGGRGRDASSCVFDAISVDQPKVEFRPRLKLQSRERLEITIIEPVGWNGHMEI